MEPLHHGRPAGLEPFTVVSRPGPPSPTARPPLSRSSLWVTAEHPAGVPFRRGWNGCDRCPALARRRWSHHLLNDEPNQRRENQGLSLTAPWFASGPCSCNVSTPLRVTLCQKVWTAQRLTSILCQGSHITAPAWLLDTPGAPRPWLPKPEPTCGRRTHGQLLGVDRRCGLRLASARYWPSPVGQYAPSGELTLPSHQPAFSSAARRAASWREMPSCLPTSLRLAPCS